MNRVRGWRNHFCAVFVAVAHAIDKLVDRLVCVELRRNGEVLVFVYAEEQCTAIGIGERTHTFPDALAQCHGTAFRFVIGVVIVLGPKSFDGLNKRFFDDCHSASLSHHYHITIIHTIM